mmetsp:Transcript_16909/g.25581  ORF Transcript_16909/g.25581 Transcript_16909/m.25581 type:complete len:96 (-) Transcript_16909:900-1187(-)
MVPLMVAKDGMTLCASPALMAVTEITPPSSGDNCLEIIDCILVIRLLAATMGSTVKCGMAACPPFPCNVIVNVSQAAVNQPGRVATTPLGNVGQT